MGFGRNLKGNWHHGGKNISLLPQMQAHKFHIQYVKTSKIPVSSKIRLFSVNYPTYQIRKQLVKQDALPVLLCSVSCSFCSEVADNKTFKYNKPYESIIEETMKTPNTPKELF